MHASSQFSQDRQTLYLRKDHSYLKLDKTQSLALFAQQEVHRLRKQLDDSSQRARCEALKGMMLLVEIPLGLKSPGWGQPASD